MKRLRKTRLQQLHLIIAVLIALIVTAVCLVLDTGLMYLAVWVSLSIIIFYTLGQIVRLYLTNLLKPEETEAEEIVVGEESDSLATDEAGVYANAYAEFENDNS
jgi:hypothetical protein